MSFYNTVKLMVNILLVLIVLIVIIWIIREIKINKLNKRINKNSIAKNNTRHSLFDIIVNLFLSFRNKINKLLKKSSYFKKYALKYEKYLDKNKPFNREAMDFVSTKFCLAFLSVLLLVISMVIQNDHVTISRIIIAFTLGFFAYDMFLISSRKINEYEMKNDLLKAITIMNNCFKSGRSIIQTIQIVGDEIEGQLKKEFIKMHEDLAYGLELEVVFERFNKRVNLKEVKYITTSLNILNKTGGNIVDVFSSIEKTVFNNKKLEDELKNLSAASKALYRILSIIPIIFIFIIYILDPTYFMPLFTNPIGILILTMIITIYIAYIIIVKKIIRIKEY